MASQDLHAARLALDRIKRQDPPTYKDLVADDIYRATGEELSGRRVLDLGANVGMFALLALSKGARSVVAVEPDPCNFARLVENVRGFPVVPLNVAALGPSQRTGVIRGFSSSCSIVASGAGVVVEGRALRALLSLFPEDDGDLVLKMDVEGSEFDVLLNAAGEDVRRFSTIYVEIHGQEPPSPLDTGKLQAYIRYLGYEERWHRPLFWYQWDGQGRMVSCKPIPLDTFKYARK